MGYLCANFSLPRPLCSRVTPDVRDRRPTDRRQTSDRRQTKAWGGGIINEYIMLRSAIMQLYIINNSQRKSKHSVGCVLKSKRECDSNIISTELDATVNLNAWLITSRCTSLRLSASEQNPNHNPNPSPNLNGNPSLIQ